MDNNPVPDHTPVALAGQKRTRLHPHSVANGLDDENQLPASKRFKFIITQLIEGRRQNDSAMHMMDEETSTRTGPPRIVNPAPPEQPYLEARASGMDQYAAQNLIHASMNQDQVMGSMSNRGMPTTYSHDTPSRSPAEDYTQEELRNVNRNDPATILSANPQSAYPFPADDRPIFSHNLGPMLKAPAILTYSATSSDEDTLSPTPLAPNPFNLGQHSIYGDEFLDETAGVLQGPPLDDVAVYTSGPVDLEDEDVYVTPVNNLAECQADGIHSVPPCHFAKSSDEYHYGITCEGGMNAGGSQLEEISYVDGEAEELEVTSQVFVDHSTLVNVRAGVEEEERSEFWVVGVEHDELSASSMLNSQSVGSYLGVVNLQSSDQLGHLDFEDGGQNRGNFPSEDETVDELLLDLSSVVGPPSPRRSENLYPSSTYQDVESPQNPDNPDNPDNIPRFDSVPAAGLHEEHSGEPTMDPNEGLYGPYPMPNVDVDGEQNDHIGVDDLYSAIPNPPSLHPNLDNSYRMSQDIESPRCSGDHRRPHIVPESFEERGGEKMEPKNGPYTMPNIDDDGHYEDAQLTDHISDELRSEYPYPFHPSQNVVGLDHVIDHFDSQSATGLYEEQPMNQNDGRYTISNHYDDDDPLISFSPPLDLSPSAPVEITFPFRWNDGMNQTPCVTHGNADDNQGQTHGFDESVDVASTTFLEVDREEERDHLGAHGLDDGLDVEHETPKFALTANSDEDGEMVELRSSVPSQSLTDDYSMVGDAEDGIHEKRRGGLELRSVAFEAEGHIPFSTSNPESVGDNPRMVRPCFEDALDRDDLDHTMIDDVFSDVPSASVPPLPSSKNPFHLSSNSESIHHRHPDTQTALSLYEEHYEESMDTNEGPYATPNHVDDNEEMYLAQPPDILSSAPFEDIFPRPWNDLVDHTYGMSHVIEPYSDCVVDDSSGWTHEITEAPEAVHVGFEMENEESGDWNNLMSVDDGTHILASSLHHEGSYTSISTDFGDPKKIGQFMEQPNPGCELEDTGIDYTEDTKFPQKHKYHTPLTDLPPAMSLSTVPPSPSPSARPLPPSPDTFSNVEVPRSHGDPVVELSVNNEINGAPMDTTADPYAPIDFDNSAERFNISSQRPDSCFPASVPCPSPMSTNHPQHQFQSNHTYSRSFADGVGRGWNHVSVEEVSDSEAQPDPLNNLTFDGPILLPTTDMSEVPGYAQDLHDRHMREDQNLDSGSHAPGTSTSHNDPYCEPHGHNTDEMIVDNGLYAGVANASRFSQPEVSGDKRVRRLSPLTEIPNDPPPQTHTLPPDNALDSLVKELFSLVQNGVKSPTMKVHFRSQMAVPNLDIEILKGILDRCYRYVGACSERVPPAAALHEHGSDDGHISADSGPPPKLYEPPKRRPEVKNFLAESVRREAGILLGTLVRDESLAEPIVSSGKMLLTVSARTAKDLENSIHEGPTVENFILQLDKGRRTHWNKAAADVFCKYFRSLEGCKNYRRKDVYEAFMGHITQLKRIYERQGNGKSADEKADEQRARRLARRYTLLQRRMAMFTRIYHHHQGPLGELAQFIRRLTIDCMSGDETGSDGKFYKTTVEWRSQELTDLLNLLSAWYLAERYLGGGKYSPGELPRPRYSSNRVERVLQADAAIAQLPINWYNPSWLTEYKERQNTLSPLSAVALKLPDYIIREAKRFLQVRFRSDLPLPPNHSLVD